MQLTGLFILLLIAAGVMVYSNSFHGSFVFDDINFITKNDPNVHMTQFSWDALKKAALEGHPRHRYLPNISFAINYWLGGENTFGYHLVNLGIHLLNGIFLFFLFRTTLYLCRRTDSPCFSAGHPLPPVLPEVLSFFATLIWLVHPVQTGAVTYICQRMASMVAMFYILSLLCYVTGRVSFRKKKPATSAAFFVGALVAGGCAVTSKENAGMLPVFILLYEWFFFQNLKITRSKKTLVWTMVGLVFFGAVVIYFLGANPLQRILDSYTPREFNLPQRVMTEFRVVTYYLSLLFYPAPWRLILDHNYPLSFSLFDPVTTGTCLAGIIAIAGLAIFLLKRDRLLSFALLWFLGNLVIESSVIGIEIIYEHRMYLPTMFLYLAITIMVFKRVKFQKAAAGILILCVLVLAGWTYQRNRVWKTDVTFWTDCVHKSPQKARPYQNLAYSLQVRRKFKDALIYYKKSLTIKPHPVAYFNMGLCLNEIGYYSDAVDAYINALKMNYNTPQVNGDLAMSLAHIGEFQAALSYYTRAAKMNPANPAFNNQAQRLAAFLHQYRDPIKCLRMSIAKAPKNPALRFKLATVYEKQGKPDQAYALYEKIRNEIGASDRKLYLQVLSRMAAWNTLKGEPDRALQLLHEGIAAAPENPYFYYEIAAFYGMSGDDKNALIWLDKAVKKGYHNPEQIKTDQRFNSIRNTQFVQNLMKMK